MTELDHCWEDCLQMYKWVASVYDRKITVRVLKIQYLRKYGFASSILDNCFFCQYKENNRDLNCDKKCAMCPAILVDSSFRCWRAEYSYRDNPKKFYKKLIELNAIRLQKQKEGAEE